MASRFQRKDDMRIRAANIARNSTPDASLPSIPKQLKQRVTDLILEGRDKADFEARSFGCKALFLPGMVIEVVWRTPMPQGLPKMLRMGKAEYRLVHRMWRADEAWGDEDPMLNISNGYKWKWWQPPPDPNYVDPFYEKLRANGFL